MRKIIHKTLSVCLFSVVCQLCGILLYYNLSRAVSVPEPLIHECAEMLKYSLMEIIIICAGGAIFCRIQKEST